MRLMGYRQAQTVALNSEAQRLKWIKLCAGIGKGRGKPKWRSVPSEKLIDQDYTLR